MKKILLLTLLAAILNAEPTYEDYDNNCTAGDKFSCLDMGMGLFHAGNDNQNRIYIEQSKGFLNKACNLGAIAGCDLLGHIYMLDGNLTGGMELFTKTCDQNSSYGCLNLGVIYAQGQGTKTDIKRAKKYLKKSCEMKNINACEMLNLY